MSIITHGCSPTSSPGLFPQKMGGAGKDPLLTPHPFFKEKALGTRLGCSPYYNMFDLFDFYSRTVRLTNCSLIQRSESHSRET